MVTEVRRIRVEVKGNGTRELRQISRGFGQISRNAQRTTSILSRFDRLFRGVFAGTLAGVGVRAITQAADSLQLLRDRIRVFEGEGADETFNLIAQAAVATRTSVESLAEVYNRVALSTKELGLESEEVVALTTALQQSFRLSGASIQEATSATIQLTQGLSAGALRGQELRSVLESNAVVSGILAEEFGVARGALIKLAETGAITSQRVISALSNNFAQLNEDAANLGQTFGQTVTIALDRFRLRLDEVNRSLGLNSAFARSINFIIDNFDTLVAILGALATGVIVSRLVAGIGTLTAAFTGLGGALNLVNIQLTAGLALSRIAQSINPIVAGLTLLAGAVIFLAQNWERARLIIAGATSVILKSIQDFVSGSLSILADFTSAIPGLDGLSDRLRSLSDDAAAASARTEENLLGIADALNKVEEEGSQFNLGGAEAALDRAAARTRTLQLGTLTLQQRIKALNAEFANSNNLEEYQRRLNSIKLDDLNKQLKDGRIDLIKYNEEVEKLNGNNSLAKLNQNLKEGTISFDEYNQSIREIEFQRVQRGFEQGTSSIQDLRRAGLEASETFDPQGALFVGTANYVERVGTLSSNVADAIGNTFGRLEDSLLEFTQTGRFEFRKFTAAILEDLQRIIIRQLVIRQIANSITGAAAGGGGGAGATGGIVPNAQGNAFGANGIIPFQNGGIVSSPTLFGFGRNQTGLMGEAGPEAIVPLRRGSSGELGVGAVPANVNVNVINNADNSQVEQRETIDSQGNRSIDIVINNVVRESIQNGALDSTFRQSFGLSRQGA